MAELGNALAIVLSINALLFLGQVAALEMNPEGPVQFYNCQGSILGQLETGSCAGPTYILNDTNPSNLLPSQGSQIQISNGNIFTDTFSAAISWLTQTTGLNYLYQIVSAPSNFLKALGLPQQFSFAIGALWYGFTFFLIVAYIMGRDY